MGFCQSILLKYACCLENWGTLKIFADGTAQGRSSLKTAALCALDHSSSQGTEQTGLSAWPRLETLGPAAVHLVTAVAQGDHLSAGEKEHEVRAEGSERPQSCRDGDTELLSAGCGDRGLGAQLLPGQLRGNLWPVHTASAQVSQLTCSLRRPAAP